MLETLNFGLTSATTNTDVSFDAAGNMYVTNRSSERMQVWSPGGSTVFTTGSDGSFVAAAVSVPEPTMLAAIAGLGGLTLVRRRRR